MTLGIIGEKYLQSLPPKRVRHCGYGYMQTLDVTVNWKKRGSWSIEIADVFQITRDTISLCQKKQQQKKQEEVDLCITVVCNFFKKLKQKACVKQQIMCDYDDSLFTRGRLGSHLGRSPDWDGRTSVTNELDGTKRTTASATTFLFSSPRGMTTLCFCLMF